MLLKCSGFLGLIPSMLLLHTGFYTAAVHVPSQFLSNDTAIVDVSAETEGAIGTSLPLGLGLLMGQCWLFSYVPPGSRHLYGISVVDHV